MSNEVTKYGHQHLHSTQEIEIQSQFGSDGENSDTSTDFSGIFGSKGCGANFQWMMAEFNKLGGTGKETLQTLALCKIKMAAVDNLGRILSSKEAARQGGLDRANRDLRPDRINLLNAVGDALTALETLHDGVDKQDRGLMPGLRKAILSALAVLAAGLALVAAHTGFGVTDPGSLFMMGLMDTSLNLSMAGASALAARAPRPPPAGFDELVRLQKDATGKISALIEREMSSWFGGAADIDVESVRAAVGLAVKLERDSAVTLLSSRNGRGAGIHECLLEVNPAAAAEFANVVSASSLDKDQIQLLLKPRIAEWSFLSKIPVNRRHFRVDVDKTVLFRDRLPANYDISEFLQKEVAHHQYKLPTVYIDMKLVAFLVDQQRMGAGVSITSTGGWMKEELKTVLSELGLAIHEFDNKLTMNDQSGLKLGLMQKFRVLGDKDENGRHHIMIDDQYHQRMLFQYSLDPAKFRTDLP